MLPPTRSTDYFERLVDLEHAPGDIWSDLPLHGLLGLDRSSGIVITPACDLANRKVETLTYLPIVSIDEWCWLRPIELEIRRSLAGVCAEAGVDSAQLADTSRACSEIDLARLRETLVPFLTASPTRNAKLDRCQAALEYLAILAGDQQKTRDRALCARALGARPWTEILRRLCTNSWRSDVHFLPADFKPAAWSAIPLLSLVLFRYPMTAPIEIFDMAHDINLPDWQACLRKLERRLPLALAFRDARPLKRSGLRQPFLSDLLTRYAALYLRLGSPDFDERQVDDFIATLGGTP